MPSTSSPAPRPWYKRKRFTIPIVTLTVLIAAASSICLPPLLQPMGQPGRFDDELDRAAAIAMPREGKDAWPVLIAACEEYENIARSVIEQREQELGRKLYPNEVPDGSALLIEPEPPGGLTPEQVENALLSRRVMNALDAANFWTKLDALADCGHTVQPRERGVPLLDFKSPQLGQLRGIQRFNGVRLQLAARRGEGVVVVQCLTCSMNLARLTPPDSGLLASLVSLAVQMHATKALREEASAGRLDEPTLRACAEVLQKVERVRGDRLFATERVHGLDLMELVHTDDGQGSGYLNVHAVDQLPAVNATPSRIGAIAGALLESKAQVRARHAAIYDRCIAALDSDAPAPSICTTLQADWEAIKVPRTMFLGITLPDFVKCVGVVRRAEADVDATRLTLALQRFHAQHARYPTTHDELASNFLAEVPLDRFTMMPFGYQVDNTAEPHTCLIYSVGYDLTDNAAAENPNNANASLTVDAPDTDFVWARLQSVPVPAAAN